MLARSPRIGLAILLALSLAAAPSARAQEDACDGNLLGLRWAILELKALRSALQKEQQFFERSPTAPPPSGQPVRVDPEELLISSYSKTHEARQDELAKVKNQFNAKRGTIKKAWCQACAEEADVQARWKNAESHYGKRDDVNSPPLWDLQTVGIVAWGLVLFLVSCALYLHGWRRELRSYFRFHGKMGAAAAASLLVVLLSSFASLSFAQGKADGQPELEKLREELAALKKAVAELESEVDSKRDERLNNLAAQFAPRPGEKNGFQTDFVKTEKRASGEFREIMQTAKLVELAGQEGTNVLARVKDEREKLAEFEERGQERLRKNIGIKIGLCAAFLLLAFLPVRRLRRAKLRQRKLQAVQCPCCLANKTLKEKSLDAQDERFPEPTYLKCSECGYEMRASYQKLPRLCFPAVGVPASGKTHWLVTAYDSIKKVRVPVRAALQCAPSMSDEKFDIEIERILENHMRARATVHDRTTFPYPLVFHLKDCDDLGKNEGMLNLFDLGGEMMKTHVNVDVVRQRALLMDGFVLFLDPTKVKLSKGDDSIKNQIDALKAFHQEIRDMRGVDVGKPIPVPIAVCISKLDLIVTKNPLSQASRPWIKELRESFRNPLSLAEIHKRSKLCEDKLSILFPGWSLPRTLNEQFGGRFLFFPLTPVSLVEDELGREDLARTIEPVGILEPILWLLHMHGFKVLQ
jgi:hypothetical protein